jgi:hypothetical protein
MASSTDTTELAIQLAVLNNRVGKLEDSCELKHAKIEALEAFQNRLVGYALAASFGVTLVLQLWQQLKS